MILYIDPGTGSMLFTVLLGIIGASIYSLRMLFIKIRFKITGGKAEVNNKKIPFVIFSDDKRCRYSGGTGFDVCVAASDSGIGASSAAVGNCDAGLGLQGVGVVS